MIFSVIRNIIKNMIIKIWLEDIIIIIALDKVTKYEEEKNVIPSI